MSYAVVATSTGAMLSPRSQMRAGVGRAGSRAEITLSGAPLAWLLAGGGIVGVRRGAGRLRSRACVRFPQKWYSAIRGLWRIWNSGRYRLKVLEEPPADDDQDVLAWPTTLPYTHPTPWPTDDAAWYAAVALFNGVLSSGHLPQGPAGEPYFRFDILGGDVVGLPPSDPQARELEQVAGGVARVHGRYFQSGPLRADQWAIGYTTDGEDPGPGQIDYAVDFARGGMAVLAFDLPAQGHGTLVKVMLRVRRNDGTDLTPVWRYSEDQTILSITISTTGPTAPTGGTTWPGALPEDG